MKNSKFISGLIIFAGMIAAPSDAHAASLLEIYQQALAPEGVLLMHISNRYIKLEPMIARPGRPEGAGPAAAQAVVALGQLGDPAALPVLERLATGRDCDHARDVCQKEVRKAIEGCRGATNLTAILWRQAAPRPSGRGP